MSAPCALSCADSGQAADERFRYHGTAGSGDCNGDDWAPRLGSRAAAADDCIGFEPSVGATIDVTTICDGDADGRRRGSHRPCVRA